MRLVGGALEEEIVPPEDEEPWHRGLMKERVYKSPKYLKVLS